jgi:hypothetical protein
MRKKWEMENGKWKMEKSQSRRTPISHQLLQDWDNLAPAAAGLG